MATLYAADLFCGAGGSSPGLISAAEARIPSISSIYWCAFLYENEIHDLFNVQVDGIAVDFHGHLYETAVKFPFGSTKPPVAKPAPPVAPAAPAAAHPKN